MINSSDRNAFVNWFRSSSPYIHAFRGRTFVITFGGEIANETLFASFLHDVALLSSLGIRVVLVHGARPQIEARLKRKKIASHYEHGIRVTDEKALACVKEAVGTLRMEIEALLSMGLANSPMAGASIRVTSGNFITAKPIGIKNGIDFHHTGEVRRVDTAAINQQLDNGAIVVLSPAGYSPTGEVFNLSALDVATSVACDLKAHKLLCLTDTKTIKNRKGRVTHQLTLGEARSLVNSKRKLDETTRAHIDGAIRACQAGVRRTHILNRHVDGILLMELFSRDGIGTMITADAYESIRQAHIEDVGGIIELIAPLENEGVLARRSREQLELEISYFHVVERDGAIIACAALYPYHNEKYGELACLAVHPNYQKSGWGNILLERVVQIAREMELKILFALTTRTLHWFRERGFVSKDLSVLPLRKRAMYNYQRNAKVLIRPL